MKVKSIKVNALFNVIYTITNMIFPLITYPYVTRVLSASGMGKVSFFTAVSNYAVMFGSLGISTYGIRAVAKVRDNKHELSKVVQELLIINGVITLIVVGVLLGLIPFVNKFNSEPILFVVNTIIILATPFGMTWLYSGLEQYEYITIRNIIFKMAALIMVFLLVKNKDDYAVYAFLTAFSTVASYICNLIYSRKFVDFHIIQHLEFLKHFKPMLYLFASILAVSVYTNLDTIMLGFINGNFEVGLYSVASKVKWLLLAAVNAVSAVLLPRLSNYYSNGKMKKYYDELRKSLSFVSLVTIPLVFYFILEARDCILLLGGADYRGAIPCMQILMPILIVSGLSNVSGNQVLIPQGRDSKFMQAVGVGAIVDIVLNIIFMPRYAAIGAAIATLIAETTQMLIQLYFSREDILLYIRRKTIVNALFASIIPAVLIYFIRKNVNINCFINIIITSCIFFLVYAIVLLLIKDEYTYDFLKNVISWRKEKNEDSSNSPNEAK